MAAMFSEDSDIIRDSVMVVSEDLWHDSSAVQVFIQTLAYHIQTSTLILGTQLSGATVAALNTKADNL